MVRTFQPNIRRAKSIVRGELDIIEAERVAFQRFLKRLDDLETSPPPDFDASATPTTPLLTGPRPESDYVATVRTAYAETVMEAPHYSEEYNDSVDDSIAEEFGESTAEILRQNERLSEYILRIFVDKARYSLTNRGNFVSTLQRELESLEESELDLNEVENAAQKIYESIYESEKDRKKSQRLRCLEQRCERVASRRQRLIHNRSTRAMSGVDTESLLEYLYDELEVQCPVLADVSGCLRTIRAARERVSE